MAEKFYWTMPSSWEKFFISTTSRYNMYIKLKMGFKKISFVITNNYQFTKIVYEY